MTIAVGERSTEQIHFYNDSGELLSRSTASFGDDRHLLRVRRCEGRNVIAAQDYHSRRVTFLSDAGSSLRSIILPTELAFAQILACPIDGSVVVLHPLPAHLIDPGVSFTTAQLVVVDPSGATRVLREFGKTEYFHAARDRVFIEQPLGRLAMAAAAGGRFFLGDSNEEAIDIVDQSGSAVGRFDTHLTPRAANIGDVLQAITSRLYSEASPGNRDVLRTAIVQAPLQASRPLYDAMIADAAGNIWLRTFEISRTQNARWKIFDPNGRAIAFCDLPGDLFVDEIGSDFIAGIRRGPQIAEQADLYRLIKQSAGS